MTKLAMSLLIVLALGGGAASQQRGQTPADLGSLRPIIPGHYVYTLNNNSRLFNSGIVSTNDRALVFDALEFEPVARAGARRLPTRSNSRFATS